MAEQKVKWTKVAIDAYKAAGQEMYAGGLKPLREIPDPDCGTVLTIWGGNKTVIQQTWTDTGDVCFYRAVNDAASALEGK